MEISEFNTAVHFAITNGLVPSKALKYVHFMDNFKPEDLRLQSSYAFEWIKRFKDEPTRHMDDHCMELYSESSAFINATIEGI